MNGWDGFEFEFDFEFKMCHMRLIPSSGSRLEIVAVFILNSRKNAYLIKIHPFFRALVKSLQILIGFISQR